MRVHSVQSRGGRRHQTQQSRKGTVAKTGEPQIEPGHVRFYTPDRAQQTGQVASSSETPTAHYPKAGQFIRRRGKIISQHRQINAGLLPKLIGHVKPIFVERMATWWKRGDERDPHGWFERNTRSRESRPSSCR